MIIIFAISVELCTENYYLQGRRVLVRRVGTTLKMGPPNPKTSYRWLGAASAHRAPLIRETLTGKNHDTILYLSIWLLSFLCLFLFIPQIEIQIELSLLNPNWTVANFLKFVTDDLKMFKENDFQLKNVGITEWCPKGRTKVVQRDVLWMR